MASKRCSRVRPRRPRPRPRRRKLLQSRKRHKNGNAARRRKLRRLHRTVFKRRQSESSTKLLTCATTNLSARRRKLVLWRTMELNALIHQSQRRRLCRSVLAGTSALYSVNEYRRTLRNANQRRYVAFIPLASLLLIRLPRRRRSLLLRQRSVFECRICLEIGI